jgi:hypothetical protein
MWEGLQARHRKLWEKLNAEGFERVEVEPLAQGPDGKYTAREVREHQDGRRIELHINFDPKRGSGTIKTVEHSVPPGVHRKNPMSDVKDNRTTVIAAHENPKAFVKKHSLIGSPAQNNVGRTYRVDFNDGTSAIFKPEKEAGLVRHPNIRPALSPNNKIPESHRELAAFKISEMAGFNIHPAVDLGNMNIDGYGRGHAMGFVEGGSAQTSFYDDARKGHPDIQRMAALDFITDNKDRHPKNFMKGKKGRYYSIDMGLVFPDDTNPEDFRSHPYQALVDHQTKLDPEVRKEIENLKPEDIQRAMSESGFSERDIAGATARHRALKEMGDKWIDHNILHKRAMAYAGHKQAYRERRADW